MDEGTAEGEGEGEHCRSCRGLVGSWPCFVAGMYTVTAQEVVQANRECESRHLAAGRWVPDRERTPESMPLMSFPWLFRRELGDIAMRRSNFNSVCSPTTNNSASFAPPAPVIMSVSAVSGGAVQAPGHQVPVEARRMLARILSSSSHWSPSILLSPRVP